MHNGLATVQLRMKAEMDTASMCQSNVDLEWKLAPHRRRAQMASWCMTA